MTPIVQLVEIPGTIPNHEPVCDICKRGKSEVNLREFYNRRGYRCGSCHAAIVRESHAQKARGKLKQLLDSLPQSRNGDDESMLAQANDRLRRFYAGWARKVSLSALVTGLSGSCKTLTLAAKARSMIEHAVGDFADRCGESDEFEWVSGIYFVTAFNLCEATRQHQLGKGECPDVTRARTASLLILDDICNENPGNEKLILSIVDARIAANLPTWATSGFTVDDINLRYGQALTRRLCERGTGTLIDLFRLSSRKLEAVK